MAHAITILVGTMTGTAEMVAAEIKSVLTGAGHSVEIVPMDNQDASAFRRPGLFVICTSTYGQGDVPDNAKALYDSLKNERPDLSRLRYGVFGLGDSTYFDTFNNGGKQFDEILAELGATRIGDRVEHNASGDVIPEDAGVEWAKAWVKQIEPVPAEAG